MIRIRKSRREWFGGIVYSEHPGFTAYVDDDRADYMGIPRCEQLPEGLLSAPMDVHLAVTTRCNLQCEGCYTRVEERACKQADRDMPLDEARRIIDLLAAMNVFTVALGGGEPLLHPHVFEIARYARDRAIVPNMTTNGLCIDAATAEACRVFGSIHVSCHDASELDRLTATFRQLRAAGIDPGLNLLVSGCTYDRLRDILKWCARQRVSRVLFLKFKLTENNRQCGDMILTREQERELLPIIRRQLRFSGIMPLLDCSFFPALAVHKPRKRDLERFDVNGCQGAAAYLAITVDGMVKPCSFCSDTVGGLELLNREAWVKSAALCAFRNGPRNEQCAKCNYSDLCNGGCRICRVQCCQDGGE